MPWRVRRTVVSWANRSIGLPSCTVWPCPRPAPRCAAPGRPAPGIFGVWILQVRRWGGFFRRWGGVLRSSGSEERRTPHLPPSRFEERRTPIFHFLDQKNGELPSTFFVFRPPLDQWPTAPLSYPEIWVFTPILHLDRFKDRDRLSTPQSCLDSSAIGS